VRRVHSRSRRGREDSFRDSVRYIQGDNELRQWKPSVLPFGHSFANVKPRLILDSEQPRLELCNGGLLFTAEDCLPL
jgi:hypothetical protein